MGRGVAVPRGWDAGNNFWLHVDAAYVGNALTCLDLQYVIKGIEVCHWEGEGEGEVCSGRGTGANVC